MLTCEQCIQAKVPHQFLPKLEGIKRFPICVSCMLENQRKWLYFLESAEKSPLPDRFISKATPNIRSIAETTTCIEDTIKNFLELKKELKLRVLRPQTRKPHKDRLHMTLKCATNDECLALSEVIELPENAGYLLKQKKQHTCTNSRQLFSQAEQQCQQFTFFADAATRLLSQESLEKVIKLPMDLMEVKRTMKQLHQQVHAQEDQAIANSWEGSCKWRRERGNANQTPNVEDLQKLLEIAQRKGVPLEVIKYIQNGFDTEPHTPYFQQRGYFMLLALSPETDLCKVITKRLEVLLYAANLLKQDLFLLCYKSLNVQIQRNHAWMIIQLLFSLRFQKGIEGQSFPLFGQTQPVDSASSHLYPLLLQFDQEFYESTKIC